MRKGQVTVEFIVIAAFMLLLFSTIFVGLQTRITAMRTVQNYEALGQVGNLIGSEVRMAAQVGEGYEREFILPGSVNGNQYNLSLVQDWDLVVEYGGLEYIEFLELPVTGSLVKGRNFVMCCETIGGQRYVKLNPPEVNQFRHPFLEVDSENVNLTSNIWDLLEELVMDVDEEGNDPEAELEVERSGGVTMSDSSQEGLEPDQEDLWNETESEVFSLVSGCSSDCSVVIEIQT